MSDSNNASAENVVPQSKAELPQWVQDELTEARNEAAKYRTQKNEAVEAAKAEVTESFSKRVEELEAALSAKDGEAAGSRNEVERLKAALEAGIGADKVLGFADLLKGENPEELRSHAEELKKLFTNGEVSKSTPAFDPSQGQSSNELPLNGDPLLNSLKAALHIK